MKMSIKPNISAIVVASCFAALIVLVPASAQMSTGGQGGCLNTTGPCQRDASGSGGQDGNVTTSGTTSPASGDASLAFQDNTTVVKGKPYQGQAVTTITQFLSDGSKINQSITANIARDKDGRTVRIQELGKFGPLTAPPSGAGSSPVTLTTIFDPVAKLHIDFTSDSSVAHELVVQSPTPGTTMTSQGGFGLSSNSPMMMRGRRAVPMAIPPPSSPNNSDDAEQLGTKTIAGVSAIGTRKKTVIPEGTIGNDHDITVVRETWYSPDLRMVLESTQDDPRFGQTTYTIVQLDQTEPDPSLFQIPSGYTAQTTPVYTTSQ